MPRNTRTPSYRLHKPSGQAVVTLNGRDHYLGRWGTLASRQAYARLVQRWLDNGKVVSPDALGATVNELLSAYLEFATAYYRKDDRPTSQIRHVRSVSHRLRERFGRQSVGTLTPGKVREWLDSLVAEGLTRQTCNTYLKLLKRMLRWGCERELVPPTVWQGCQAVRGLSRGRSAAIDRPPVKPVALADIEATLAVLAEPFASMIRLQLATGMRPGEVVAIKAEEIDRSDSVWVYRPGHHKTEHHGRDRVILLGPTAQAVLSPFLLRTAGFAFEPHTYRQYKHAIEFAQRKHNLVKWSPNQLRHSFATQVRARYGLDTTQALLGHSSADMTEVYAERSLEPARKAAAEIG